MPAPKRAADSAPPVPAGSLLDVIAIIAGTIVAAWTKWPIRERTYFLAELERIFPAFSASLVTIIERRVAD